MYLNLQAKYGRPLIVREQSMNNWPVIDGQKIKFHSQTRKCHFFKKVLGRFWSTCITYMSFCISGE